jgi:predicted dehydrogenase
MSDERPVTIGIIGAARVAVYAMIAPAKTERRAHLLSVAARDPARAAVYAEKHGIPRHHASYDAMFADPEIELVYIATPPSLHAELAIAAIAAGKHVLVEKPFSMSANEAETVARAGEAAKRYVFEAMHARHHALFRRIVEIVRSGKLGKIKSASGVFDVKIPNNAEEFRWQKTLGGGALMDLGVYPLAWLRGSLGEPVVESARATIVDGVDAEISATLSLPSGIAGTMKASMVADAFAARLRIEGSDGVLDVTNPLAPQMGHSLQLTVRGVSSNETVDGPSTFAAQLAAACLSIRDGTPFPLPERDYVRSMKAIDAVRQAARI